MEKENSFSGSILGVDKFFAIFPLHIIEQILSFCSCKDLLKLTKTCRRFRDVVTQSNSLMRKFCFKVDFENRHEDAPSFKEMKQCLKNRKHKNLRICCKQDDPAGQIEIINKLLTMVEYFSEIENLELLSCCFTTNQFVLLLEIFPSMQKCYIERCKDDKSISRVQELTQHNSLIELKLIVSDILSSLELLSFRNLKSLFIDGVNDLKDEDGTSFWQHLHFEPEEIDTGFDDLHDEPNVVNFLRRQAKLKRLTCKIYRGTVDILLQLPSIERFITSSWCANLNGNLNGFSWCCLFSRDDDCPYVNLSEVPHHRLDNFWIKTGLGQFYYFEYSPDAPKNIEAFERDVLRFLIKNSNLIGCVTLGKESWLGTRVVLSKNFVQTLIAVLPNLERLELFSGSHCHQTYIDIIGSGREFKEIKVHATDGAMSFRNPEANSNEE